MASPVTMVFSSVLKINFIDSVFIILNNDCSFAPARWVKFFFFCFLPLAINTHGLPHF